MDCAGLASHHISRLFPPLGGVIEMSNSPDNATLPKDVDVLIIGAGHAGLAMSGFLNEANREHVVIDRRDRLGGGWQDRWDQFRLVTPNWTSSFPGWAYDGTDPDGFMSRDEITARVARYAEVVRAPVALGTEMQRLTPIDGAGFLATTSRGELLARQVVVATGSYHTPRIPALARHVSDRVTQLHSHAIGTRRACPQAACSSLVRDRPGCSWPRSCLRRAGRCTSRLGPRAGCLVATAAATSSAGWWKSSERGDAVGVTLPTAEQLPDGRRRFSAMPAVGPRRRPRHELATVRGRRDDARRASDRRRRRAIDVCR